MQYVRFIFMFSGRKMHFENKLSQPIEINGERRGAGKMLREITTILFPLFYIKRTRALIRFMDATTILFNILLRVLTFLDASILTPENAAAR